MVFAIGTLCCLGICYPPHTIETVDHGCAATRERVELPGENRFTAANSLPLHADSSIRAKLASCK